MLSLYLPAVDINGVGKGLEGIKADAQRHGDGLPAAVRRERTVILKERQDRQQPCNANAQERRFAGAFPRGHAASAQVGEHGNGNRDRQHRRHRQRVKYPAGRQQKRALPALRQMQVDGGHDQQKAEKSKTLQAHGRTSPL